jgi:sirohydrochlorin cobaltochelatase
MREAGGYASVRHAHMELAHPTIEEGFDALVADGIVHVVVLPYFLALGRHASDDIPKLCEQAAGRHGELSWRLADPVGTSPKMHAVIEERISAALART